MKTVYRIILVLWVFQPCFQIAQTTNEDLTAFNNKLVKEYNAFSENKLNFAYAFLQMEEAELLDPYIKKIQDDIEGSIVKLRENEGQLSSMPFHASALQSFYAFKEVYSYDIPQLLEQRADRFESMKKLSNFFEMEEEIDAKLFSAEQNFLSAQAEFVTEHQLNTQVTRDGQIETGKALARVHAYKRYARDIYLQYFIIAKLNNDLWERYDEQDHINADLKRQEILLRGKKIINRIRKMPGFEDDTGYKDAVVAVLQKYHKLSTKEYKQLIYFQDKLEKPGAVSSEEEADLYNQMVDRHNQIISEYNTQVPILLKEMERQQELLVAKILPIAEVEAKLIGTKEEIN